MQFGHLRGFPVFLRFQRPAGYAFAGQRALDENDLTRRAVLILQMANATRFDVEGMNVDGMLHEKNDE